MNINRFLNDGFYITWKQVILVCFLTPPAALSLWFVLVKIFTADAGPQWFQAIGSVAAIGVAVWIAKTEERQRRAERKASAVSYMEGAYLISLSAAMVLRNISNELQKIYSEYGNQLAPELAGAQTQLLRSILIDIQSVDVMNIRSIGFQSEFMELKRRVYLAPNMIDVCIGNLSSVEVGNLTAWADGAEEAANKMKQHINKFTHGCG